MPADPFYWSPKWKETRFKHLRLNPWCVVCSQVGIKTRASEVDHVVARRMGGAYFHVGNLQSLCKTHHAQKTARSPESGSSRSDAPFIVSGADGYPIPAGLPPEPDLSEE